jgi:hypothetical protein
MQHRHGWLIVVAGGVILAQPYFESVHNATAVVHGEQNAFAQEPTARMAPTESIRGITTAGVTATATR